MKKYEYKSFNRKIYDDELNRLGNDGWQLINHSAVPLNDGISQYYIFMREISMTLNG